MTDQLNDGLVIEEVTPGSADDPFTQTASATTVAPSPTPDGTKGEAPADSPETKVDATAGAETKTVTDEDALPPEFEAAIQELYAQAKADAKAEMESEILPRLQSGFDRRVANIERALQAQLEASEKQAEALREETRQAKLNGLTAEEQDKLKQTWLLEDEKAKLDAFRQEVVEYHKSVFVADCISQFPELELTEDELNQFETPEEIEVFIKDSLISHLRGQDSDSTKTGTEPAKTAAAPAASTPATRTAPAGLDAPSDAGGGAAVPDPTKFDSRTGREAMAANIGSGWETVRVG